MAASPITLSSVVNLSDPVYELQEKYFRSGNVAIEGDRHVCVCIRRGGESSQVVIVDTTTLTHTSRKLTEQADAALMHPVDPVISVRGKTEGHGHFIQVFNLDSKVRLGEHQFEEDVVFWKWANHQTLAVVTKNSVYHWTLHAGSNLAPAKLFARSGKLASSSIQIINYCTDSEMKWCLLIGISTQDGRTIDGSMQLYSVERSKEQLLDGHAGCFSTLVVDESKGPTGVFAFAEKQPGQNTSRLHVRDIYASRGDGFKVVADINYPADAANDFPVAMHISQQYGILYLMTKGGHLFFFDAATGVLIYNHRISTDTVFLCTYNSKNGGVIAVNKKGLVLTAAINEVGLLPYVKLNLANGSDIAMGLAKRYGLPGCDDVLISQFNNSFARGDYIGAARIAAVMKSGALRTAQTVQQFKSVPKSGEQPSAVLQYFSTLLEYGKLNSAESVEILLPVVAQGRKEFVEKWLQDDKLECTAAVGDIIKPLDVQLALDVYLKAQATDKVIHCFMELGQFDQIIAYSKKMHCQVDYAFILRNMVNVHPEAATNFAKQLLDSQPPLLDAAVVVDIFTQQNRLQELTSVLLEYLKSNLPEQGHLQTKLLEINLLQSVQVAEAIFQMALFSHYDRKRIAQLCEKAGLYQRALEHYTEQADIRRVIARTGGQLNTDWLGSYLGKLSPEGIVECLTDITRANRQNIQVAVQMAIKYHERVGARVFIAMFDKFDSGEGNFCFLGSILAMSTDPEVHYKYIEAAAKLNHLAEVERVCRESQVYEPERVKEFLKAAKLPDPRPLIYVCDMHGFEEELAEYLYTNSLIKFIEVYVTRVNPQKAPIVLGRLIDLDCAEDFIKSLLQSVRGAAPVQPLVAELEKRNRLKLLLPWLEARQSEGSQEAEVHNALAKIYIDSNNHPDEFLNNNAYYDSAVVGRYCEDRDPHLAFTAYKRAWGSCDEQLINVSNRNGLFRLQARYLVERQSGELWSIVLDPDNIHRRQLIDQVVSTALPESSNSDEVSATVKAFIQANLPQDLVELLEKIVLHNSDFSKNKNLQNLLLLTAMKADRSRVMDYINKLDNYEGREIADIALKEEYALYEEAFQIYRKMKLNVEAIGVLLNQLDSLERATEFAARCNDPLVWSKLGYVQLRKGAVVEAVESYLKAEEGEDYAEVIERCIAAQAYDHLVTYLHMARKKVSSKDQTIDSKLIYALAKCGRLQEVHEFIESTNTANIQEVGDALYNDCDYEAAKMAYQAIPNHGRLASCHLRLGEYTQAVEAAKKANSPKAWREVSMACVSAHESKCAHIAGLHIIRHPDHLDELILHYEAAGLYDELIALLEAGIAGERPHVGLYTELGVLYAKYSPAKLEEYVRSPHVATNRLNIPKLIRACEQHQLWKEAVHLHVKYDEYDQAASTMMQHSVTSWDHDTFCKVIQKVSNFEILYRSIHFYLDEHPLLLNSMLTTIASKVDNARIVQQLRDAGQLPLILPYLLQVQSHNIGTVNDAVNELLLEGEDYEGLRRAITDFDNFDQLPLAQKLQSHELLEMRRLAALLYKKNKKYQQAIEVSKKDNHFKDALLFARDSGSPKQVEVLLRHFTSTGNRACFAACLYVCFDLVPPHVVLELAWRNRLLDLAMPYMTQVLQDFGSKITALEKTIEQNKEAAEKQKSAPNDFVPDYMMPQVPLLPGMNNLALMAPHQPQSNQNTIPNNINTAMIGMPFSHMSGAASHNGLRNMDSGGRLA